MRRITDSPWAAVIVRMLLLLGCYAGAYFKLVKRALVIERVFMTGEIEREFLPRYPGRHEYLESLFTPAHALDRKLGPGYWLSITKLTSATSETLPKPSP